MKTARPTCLGECTDGCSAVPGPGSSRAHLNTIGRAAGMRKPTSLLLIAAAAATAAGVAVPLMAPSSAGTAPPATAVAERPGSGQSVIDWNRQLTSILGSQGAQPATVHPTRSFAMLQAAASDALNEI